MRKKAFRFRRVGLALSGGAVRGLAHIGVLKALTEANIKPEFLAGTSVGSIVGAAVASGMTWKDIANMARSIFWPALLNAEGLERFCERYLPKTFDQLSLPFVAVAASIPSKQIIPIQDGNLATAISASCAMRFFRRPVVRDGYRLKDGGLVSVLPAFQCRELGAETIIGSDVWELSSILRRFGLDPIQSPGNRIYPSHYRFALENTDLLIQPSIPVTGYVPGRAAVDRMIEIGEEAAKKVLNRIEDLEQFAS
jgi:NTE family protein